MIGGLTIGGLTQPRTVAWNVGMPNEFALLGTPSESKEPAQWPSPLRPSALARRQTTS